MDSIQIKKKKKSNKDVGMEIRKIVQTSPQSKTKNKSPFDWEKGGERKEEEI